MNSDQYWADEHSTFGGNMSSDPVTCGFCGNECTPDQDIGYIVFPDGKRKPVHLFHPGVALEYDRQTENTKS